MNAEAYQRVKEIFQSVLDTEPGGRGAFLDERCNGDENLRAEVERLLASHDSQFLETPANIGLVDAGSNRAGQRIGHYTILEKIGSGGMGDVYLAEDGKLRRRIAIKLLPETLTNDVDRLNRFEQEAQTASALNHPNILTVYGIGETENTRYIATEYIDGETLRSKLNRGELTADEALDIAVQCASALSTAHENGIIHRDIKPENIMIRRDNLVKVLDFGLAKLVEKKNVKASHDAPTERHIKTAPGMIMGTVQYMSPEQARGHVTDARSDIWSFGCVLYEMFAGEPPFKGDSSVDLIAEIVKTRPAPISRFKSEVPERLDEIVAKSLEKAVEDRYQTARDLLNDLKTLKRKLDLNHGPDLSQDGLSAVSDGIDNSPSLIVTKSGQKDLSTVRGREYLLWGIKAHRLMSFWIGLLVISLLVGTAIFVRKYWRGANEVRVEYARKIRMAAQALEGSNLDQSEQLLNELKPEIGETDLRGFEWGYLSRIVTERKSAQPMVLPYDQAVESVAFSPNGSLLATGGADNLIHVWDVATGEKLKTLSGHSGPVWSVEFAPDGRKLVSGSADKTARMWDVDSGTTVWSIGSATNPIDNPRLSKDGKTIFASDADSIRAWETETAKVFARTVKTGENEVLFAVSPDGRSFAYRSGVSTVKLIDSSSGRQLATCKGHGGIVTDIKFSADSKLVLTGSVDGTARLWDAATGDDIRTFTGHKNGVYDVAFSPDGKSIATSSHDKTVRIWNLEKGYALHTFKGHIDNVQAIAFSPDGRKIASGGGGDDRGAKLWTVPSNDPRGVMRGHAAVVRYMAFAPDSKHLVSTDESNESRLWSLADERDERVLRVGGHPVYSPDGTTLAGVEGKKLRFWDIATGRVLRSIDLPRPAGAIVYSPNGEVIATNHLFEDDMLRLWDSSTGRQICSLTAHKGGVWTFVFSGDGRRLVTASIGNNSVIQWDAATCLRSSEFVGPEGSGYVALSAGNGRVVALEILANLRSLKLINLKDESETASFVGHDGDLSDARFSPYGSRLATGSKDGTVKLWDSVTGEELFKMDLMAGEIDNLAFSPDGNTLAAATGDGTIRLFRSDVVK